MCRRCIFLISNLCFTLIALSQDQSLDTIGFYSHLRLTNLLIERKTFDQEIIKNNPKDSFLLDLSIVNFKLNNPTACDLSLMKINPNAFNADEQKNKLFVSLLLLQKKYETAETALARSKIYLPDHDASVQILKGKNKVVIDTVKYKLSDDMQNIVSKHDHPYKKSPVVAGVLSTLVPGLGKIYSGNKYQGYTAFAANILLAAQTAESFYKSGLKSSRFILTAGLFTVFYAGNIWGSAATVKKKRKENRLEIENDLYNYHTDIIGKSEGTIPDLDSSTCSRSLELEKRYVNSLTDSQSVSILVLKATNKQYSGMYELAINELHRAANLSSFYSDQTNVKYLLALNFFLNGEYSKMCEVEIPDTALANIDKYNEFKIMRLHSLIETGRLINCKNELLQCCIKCDSDLVVMIKKLPEQCLLVNEVKYNRMSSIIPGLGLMKLKYYKKGITSLIINSGLLFFTGFNIAGGYYITAGVSGILPFLKFYNGGIRLTANVVEDLNNKSKNKIKVQYLDLIQKTINATAK